MIDEAKDNYHKDLGDKLCDPRSGQKVIWTAHKRLLNKKKLANIPPLVENYKFVTDFKAKAEIFNSYFAEQCHPLSNGNTLPELVYKTNSRLSNITVPLEAISAIIHKLNKKKHMVVMTSQLQC